MTLGRFIGQACVTACAATFFFSSAAKADCYAGYTERGVGDIKACDYGSGSKSGYLEIRNFKSPSRLCYTVTFNSGKKHNGCFSGPSSKPSCYRCSRGSDGASKVRMWID